MCGRHGVANVPARRRKKTVELETDRGSSYEFSLHDGRELHGVNLRLRKVQTPPLVIECHQKIRPRHRVVPPQEKVEVVNEQRFMSGEGRRLIFFSIGAKS